MVNRVCISLGENCNIRCKYCHFEKRRTKVKQEFNSNEMIAIINNIRKYMDKYDITSFKIGIVGAGEPILEFDVIKTLIEYVISVNENRIFFYTISNSILVNKNILNFFFENKSLISLNYSYDGPELIHNHGRTKYEEVFSRITEYEKCFGHKPSINCTIHRKSIEYQNELLKHFEDMKFPVITFSKIVDTNDSDFKITDDEYNNFLKETTNYKIKVRQLLPDNEKKIDCTMYGNICGVGRNNIFFTRMGVYPCGRFYGKNKYKLGNFYDELNNIENCMRNITPVAPGECYFNKNNVDKEI